ncbi:MAG: MerR family transcriptional regulator [Bacteroidales bacterium]|jgi:DNA-binding transcriptional MerR regulator|nr:MerR family transcriptional regulator [Bacteroidales bacterium]
MKKEPKEQDDLDRKIYFSIGEVAQQIGIEASTIRFWEKEFDFFLSPHKIKGIRYYKDEDIRKLKMLHYLRYETGITVEGIQKRLKENPHRTEKNYEIVSRLKEIRQGILTLMEET